MNRSLGDLIDRLSICNVKLWHLQEKVYEAEAKGSGLDAPTTAALANLNVERSHLMTAIEETVGEAVRKGDLASEVRVKIT